MNVCVIVAILTYLLLFCLLKKHTCDCVIMCDVYKLGNPFRLALVHQSLKGEEFKYSFGEKYLNFIVKQILITRDWCLREKGVILEFWNGLFARVGNWHNAKNKIQQRWREDIKEFQMFKPCKFPIENMGSTKHIWFDRSNINFRAANMKHGVNKNSFVNVNLFFYYINPLSICNTG